MMSLDDNISHALKEMGYDPSQYAYDACQDAGNNRSYKVSLPGKDIFAKCYLGDEKRRLEAEWTFLQFAQAASIDCVPRPLFLNLKDNFAIYQYIHGKKLNKNDIGFDHVKRAFDFLIDLNQGVSYEDNLRSQHRLPFAADAYLKIWDHVSEIEKRVDFYRGLTASDPSHAPLNAVIARMSDAWENLKTHLRNHAKEVNTPLSTSCLIISPSDFGFHNVLINDANMLYFIDFEYAGWDDPAKTICDFMLQPEYDVDESFLAPLVDGFVEKMPGLDHLKGRVRILLPILAFKWVCIILNCFNPEKAKRLKFAKSLNSLEAVQTERLAKAAKYLDKVDSLRHSNLVF